MSAPAASVVKRIGRGVTAAVASGLLAAVISRVLMRVVEEVTNGTPRLTMDSVFILVAYVGFLLPGCVALALTRRRWAWLVFGAGALLLLYNAVVIGIAETQHVGDMTVVRWAALAVAVTAMAATYAAQFVLAAQWSRRSSPLDDPRVDTTRKRRRSRTGANHAEGGHVV